MRRSTEASVRETAELLTPAHNYAVVQLPGRRFPGVVFQGDSLSVLVGEIRELTNLLEAKEFGELSECLVGIEEQLSAVLSSYEDACAKHGISLPYSKKE